MRRVGVLIALAASVLVVASCATAVTGVAIPDPLTAPVTITQDGFGIRAGFDDAPAEVEIYTAPPCSHCADLQRNFGDQLATLIATGQLAVTYRPLYFHAAEGRYSDAVINAMFAAVTPAGGDGSAATGPQFQRFVHELWVNQDPTGLRVPLPSEMADMARTAGVPEPLPTQIATGTTAVDAARAAQANTGFLLDVGGDQTPTVYDVDAAQILDTVYDPEWLTELTSP